MTDETTQQTEPQPGSPEYDAKMAELGSTADVMVDGEETKGTPAETQEDTKEELILGKFKSYEDLEKSYKELERKLGSRGEDKPEEKPSSETLERPDEGKEATKDGEETKEEAQESEVFSKVAAEYAEKGEFTDESKEALKAQGITEEMLGVYEAGLKSLTQARVNAAVEAVGGEEQFNAIRDWAGTSLSDAEFSAFNKSLQSAQTPEDVAIVYETLAARYNRSNPQEPQRVQGNSSAQPTSSGYSSKAEMAKDVNDPKYRSDMAFRKQVEAKLGATDFARL